jgi:hypothetical protein
VAMSYDYAAQIALLEGLSADPHPSRYELCDAHAHALTVPRGWRIELAADAPVRPLAADRFELPVRSANLA